MVVLGVGNIENVGTVTAEVDLNTYKSTSFYGIFTDASNKPTASRCYICQLGNGIQLGFDFYTGGLSSRSKSRDGWSAWTLLSQA